MTPLQNILFSLMLLGPRVPVSWKLRRMRRQLGSAALR